MSAPKSQSDPNTATADRIARLERLLERIYQGPSSAFEVTLTELRQAVLLEGIPDKLYGEGAAKHVTLRGKIWRLFLGVNQEDADSYFDLVAYGPCDIYDQICRDVIRTYGVNAKGSANFAERVERNGLVRLLNAYVRRCRLADPSRPEVYSQVWPTYANLFLMHLPEPAAFWCFVSFVEKFFPASSNSASLRETVKYAVGKFGELLKTLDPVLWDKMFAGSEKELRMNTLVGADLQSLFAARTPIEQTSRVWDILLAFGAHMSVLFAVANLILERDELLAGRVDPNVHISYKPGSSDFNAEPIIALATALLAQIKAAQYNQLANRFAPRRD